MIFRLISRGCRTFNACEMVIGSNSWRYFLQVFKCSNSLEEINRKLSEKRQELEKKKLEVDKNYMTYEQMLKMSEEELKERGVGLRHKLGVSEGELIEMGVDPEIIEKVRGSHVQVTIIEEEWKRIVDFLNF